MGDKDDDEQASGCYGLFIFSLSYLIISRHLGIHAKTEQPTRPNAPHGIQVVSIPQMTDLMYLYLHLQNSI